LHSLRQQQKSENTPNIHKRRRFLRRRFYWVLVSATIVNHTADFLFCILKLNYPPPTQIPISDGTGNTVRDFDPDEGRTFTHVLKLHLLAGGDINGKRNEIPGQICLYEEGIGGRTSSAIIGRLRKIGGDLSRQTKPMRKRLAEVYEPGDKLYIVGFSRGAAAARKIASELHEKGLITKDGEKIESPPIEFIGCFETVSMQIKKRLIKIGRTSKHRDLTPSHVLGEDGTLAPNVKKAVHNIALDDNRMWAFPMSFPPVLMGTEDRVHEAWFAGAHGDVGGNFLPKGMSDFSLEYMKEWMECLGEHSLSFIKPEDIHPECLVVDGNPDIKIQAKDVCISPDPCDNLNLYEKDGQVQTDTHTPSYRPIVVAKDDEIVPGATVNIHESVLHHMEAMKKKGSPYTVNPNLKDANFVVVGSLGKELECETKNLAKLLECSAVPEPSVKN
jgi:hypothetical protein